MYYLKEPTTEWEREMFFRANRVNNRSPYDIYHLYIELEKTSKKYFSSGKMKDGDTFKVPMKDGSELIFSFYKRSTAITRKNNDGSTDILLRKEDNASLEKKHLITLSNTYKNTGYGIGERYPDEFKRLVTEAKTGDIITFSGSKAMYLCTGTTNLYKHFEKMHERGFDGDISKYRSYETFVVDPEYDKTIQDFYDVNRDKDTSRVKARVFTDHMAQEWVNRISATTQKGDSTAVNFAGIHLLAQKQPDNSLIWYDAKKNRIDEEKVKLLYAWFKTCPVEKKVTLPNATIDSRYDYLLFTKELEEIYKTAEFSKAFARIKEECVRSGNGFVYREQSYVQDSETEFTSRGFAFVAKDGKMTVSELIFDESGKVTGVIPSSEEMFIAFCREKYDCRYHLLYTRTEEELRDRFPGSNDRPLFFTKMAEKTTKEKIIQDMSTTPLLSKSEFSEMDRLTKELIVGFSPDEDLSVDDVLDDIGL